MTILILGAGESGLGSALLAKKELQLKARFHDGEIILKNDS